MSVSEGVKQASHTEFLVIESPSVAEFSKDVEAAINSGWELAGSPYAVHAGGVTTHYQPLKRKTYKVH